VFGTGPVGIHLVVKEATAAHAARQDRLDEEVSAALLGAARAGCTGYFRGGIVTRASAAAPRCAAARLRERQAYWQRMHFVVKLLIGRFIRNAPVPKTTLSAIVVCPNRISTRHSYGEFAVRCAFLTRAGTVAVIQAEFGPCMPS
jgi:hypothetical protein